MPIFLHYECQYIKIRLSGLTYNLVVILLSAACVHKVQLSILSVSPANLHVSWHLGNTLIGNKARRFCLCSTVSSSLPSKSTSSRFLQGLKRILCSYKSMLLEKRRRGTGRELSVRFFIMILLDSFKNKGALVLPPITGSLDSCPMSDCGRSTAFWWCCNL